MQPAHGHWPAEVDLLFQGLAIAIGNEVGDQPQGAQRRELSLCTGAVAVLSADGVVFVIGADLAPVAREHGAAAGEALAVAGAGGVVVLVLPGHRQGIGMGRCWGSRGEGLAPGSGLGEDRWVGSNHGEPQLLDALKLLGLGFPGVPELLPAFSCERCLGGRRGCGHGSRAVFCCCRPATSRLSAQTVEQVG